MHFGKKLFIVMGLLVFLLTSTMPAMARVTEEGSLSEFHPWLWPYIRPVLIISKAITAKGMTFDQAAEQMKEAVTHQCDCFTAEKYEFKALLDMVRAQFEIQLAAIKLAKAKMGGFSGGGMAAFDEWDWCGTPPQPWPWPPYLIDLIVLQAELFKSEILADDTVTGEQIKLLDTELAQQVEDFASVLK